MNESSPRIITIQGEKPGKTVAIFAGVHGDEPVGIWLLDEMQKSINLKRGTLHLVYANPKAIAVGKRQIEQNLNRVFIKKDKVHTHEEKLAKQLMALLDSCDALLDLHAYSQQTGTAIPFAICEKNSFEIIKSTSIPIVLSGLHKFEKGSTDQYMYFNNKPAVCVELGAKEKPRDFIKLGRSVIYSFLAYFELFDLSVSKPKNPTLFLEVTEFYKRKSESFYFTKSFSTFDHLKAGDIIAVDGLLSLTLKNDSYIIFPREDAVVGAEAFVLAEKSPRD